jgi:hypothetical protein
LANCYDPPMLIDAVFPAAVALARSNRFTFRGG